MVQHALLYVASYFREDLPDMAALLIDNGAEVDRKDNEGKTALRWAAERRHLETVKVLLEAGADVNAVDDQGETPLIAVAPYHYNSLPVAEVLLDNGADVDAVDNQEKNCPGLGRKIWYYGNAGFAKRGHGA